MVLRFRTTQLEKLFITCSLITLPRTVKNEFVGGFLAGATSMGAGSVIMILLLLFYNRTPPVLVGTDIFHGLVLTSVTAMGQLHLYTVDRFRSSLL
jgi:uncharacterized membrane protein YfcA